MEYKYLKMSFEEVKDFMSTHTLELKSIVHKGFSNEQMLDYIKTNYDKIECRPLYYYGDTISAILIEEMIDDKKVVSYLNSVFDEKQSVKNVLVLGANGQLGQAVRAASANAKNKFVFSDVNTGDDNELVNIDITSMQSLRDIVQREKINVIVNCAAYTNVEKAEDDIVNARKLNKDAVKNIATVAKENNATLIHISTDFVYDGKKAAPYLETDEKNPINVYAQTKYEGEQEMIKSGCKYILFRTAWMFSPYGNNFMKTMIRLTSERDRLNVVYDQVGTPTYAPELAKLIVKVIEENMVYLTGEYNYTNEGSVSWYDFAVAINRACGNHCDIVPVSSQEYGSKVKRPSFSVLDKSKVKKTFGIVIPHWLDSLDESITIYNNQNNV